MEVYNKNYKPIPLSYNKNRSTGDLLEKENEYKTNFIPYKKKEQYLNEYYSYFHSTKNSEIENSKTNNATNIDNINQIPNAKITSIEKIKSTNDYLKKLNIPDDLLIEYNNRKRLDELRQKYLSNSSLHFLRKKDETKKPNQNIKKEEEKNNKEISENKIDMNKTQIAGNNFNNNEEYLKNIILEMKFKYDKLQQDFDALMENKNKCVNDLNDINEKHLYKNYLIEEINELKNINNNYEIILGLLISYINETNKILFNSPKIEYFNLKQNIWNKKMKCLDELSTYLEKCKINLLKNYTDNQKIIKYNKINLREKRISRENKLNILNQKNYFSNYDTNTTNSIRNNKSRVKTRYANSTISFRNKYINSSIESLDRMKNKTLNKTNLNKFKKCRMNLSKKRIKK